MKLIDNLERIERLNYVFAAIITVVAIIATPRAQYLGVALGAAVTCLNFAALRRIIAGWVRDVAAGNPRQNRIALILPKMILLMAAVGAILWFLPISGAAFVVGYSVFIVSIVTDAVYSAVAPPKPPADSNDSDNLENNNG